MAEAKTETKTKKTAAASTKTEAVKVAKPATAVKPAKATAPKTATTKATAAKPAASRAVKSKDLKNVSPEQRYMMICEAAYYKAERRGFSPENEIQDWIEAETEINRMLNM